MIYGRQHHMHLWSPGGPIYLIKNPSCCYGDKLGCAREGKL